MLKRNLIIGLCLLLSAETFAQKTAYYSDPAADYKKGVELFEQEKYGAAFKRFDEIINLYEHKTNAPENVVMNAKYYRALSSKELMLPQAEQFFVQLLADYGENPVTRLAYYHLGTIYYGNKKYDKALGFFKQVDVYDLSSEQTNEFRFQIGYSYFYKQKFAEALPYFEQVKTIQNKYYYPANYYYGYITYTQKKYEAALSSFNLIKESKLYSPIVPYYITQIEFLKGEYEEVLLYAVPLLERTDLKYTNEMRQLIGKSYFNTGEFATALPYLKDYYNKTAQNLKSDVYQIAYCEYKTKKYDEAMVHFLALTGLKDSLGQNSLFLLADCYLKKNKKSDARNALLNASKMNFDKNVKEQATYNYAQLSWELGFQDVASKAFQDFINDYPKSKFNADAKESLVSLLAGTNNYKGALEIIRELDGFSPSIRKSYQRIAFNRAMQLSADKNYVEADKTLDESLKNPIDHNIEADCYFWKGEIATDTKNYKDAVTDYSKYLELQKNFGNGNSGASPLLAKYGLGYAYVKQTNYLMARTYFTQAKDELKTTTLDKLSLQKISNDLYLRSGDCNFVNKDYETANKDFQFVIDNKSGNEDYALFQLAMIAGLQNRPADKIKLLQRINNEMPFSIYLDDALFETANTYFQTADYDNAILTFNRVLNDFPNSSYQKKAHLKLGLIYFNTNHTENAVNEFKFVAVNFPNTQESKEAMNTAKQVFINTGDSKGYDDFLDEIPGAKITIATKDSVVYLAAEQNFSTGDYDKALQGFTDYLNTYPTGPFATQAHYYRAECLSQNKDFEHALDDYTYVAEKTSGNYKERAILQSARIYYTVTINYPKAYEYYQLLSLSADYKENLSEALKGMMLSAWKMSDWKKTSDAAEKIIGHTSSPAEDVTEANYYSAKVAMINKDYPKAEELFTKVLKGNNSTTGAEALYSIALIYFNENKMDAAEKQCYKVIEQKPSYNYWIGKSYLLLGDIFFSQNDLFNAKATFQSIIDNYKADDDILPEAKTKLAKVTEKENEQSKVMQDSVEHSFQMDTLEQH